MANINILRTSNLTEDDEYMLIYANNAKQLQTLTGEIVDIKAFVIYEEMKEGKNGEETGKSTTIISILTEDNNVYGSNSATFIKSFENTLDFWTQKGKPEKANHFLVQSGTSKTGREFIQCVYVPKN